MKKPSSGGFDCTNFHRQIIDFLVLMLVWAALGVHATKSFMVLDSARWVSVRTSFPIACVHGNGAVVYVGYEDSFKNLRRLFHSNVWLFSIRWTEQIKNNLLVGGEFFFSITRKMHQIPESNRYSFVNWAQLQLWVVPLENVYMTSDSCD